MRQGAVGRLVAALAALACAARAQTITRVFPTRGSTYGGTYVVIDGAGFAMPTDGNPWDAQQIYLGPVPCDPMPHYTHATRIVCITRGYEPFIDTPTLPLSVVKFSGLGEVHTDTVAAAFEYTDANTPSLEWLSKWGGSAGELLTVFGEMRSVVKSAAQVRVRIGAVQCLSDEEARPIVKPSYHGRTLSCQLPSESSQLLPGRFNVSVNVVALDQHAGECSNLACFVADFDSASSSLRRDGYGSGPLVVPAPLAVAPSARGDEWAGSVHLPTGEPYHFEVYPRVDLLSPSSGGSYGGQRLTIRGASFSAAREENEVFVGGAPCAVISADEAELVCALSDDLAGASAAPPDERRTPRGLAFRTYDAAEYAAAGDGAAVLQRGVLSDRVDFVRDRGPTDYNPESRSALVRVAEGYLVPPLTANYTVYTAGDDGVSVFLSHDDSAARLVRITHFDSWSNVDHQRTNPAAFFAHAASTGPVEQLRGPTARVSHPIELRAGARYAFRIEHTMASGDEWTRIGARVSGLGAAQLADGSALDEGAAASAARAAPARALALLTLAPLTTLRRETHEIRLQAGVGGDLTIRLDALTDATGVPSVADLAISEATSASELTSFLLAASTAVFDTRGRLTTQRVLTRCRTVRSTKEISDGVVIFTVEMGCPYTHENDRFIALSIAPTRQQRNKAFSSLQPHAQLVRHAAAPVSGSFRVGVSGAWSVDIPVRTAWSSEGYSRWENLARAITVGPFRADRLDDGGVRGAPKDVQLEVWRAHGTWTSFEAFSIAVRVRSPVSFTRTAAEATDANADADPDASAGPFSDEQWLPELPELQLDTSKLVGENITLQMRELDWADPDSAQLERLPSDWFRLPDPPDSAERLVVVRTLGVHSAAGGAGAASFTVNASLTPTINAFWPTVAEAGTTLTLNVSAAVPMLADELNTLAVRLGDGENGTACDNLVDATPPSAPAGVLATLNCTLRDGPAGTHALVLVSSVRGSSGVFGAPRIEVRVRVTDVAPAVGSIGGLTPVALSGTGLRGLGCAQVLLGGRPCAELGALVDGGIPRRAVDELRRANSSAALLCLTPPLPNATGAADEGETVVVTVAQPLSTAASVRGFFTYSANATPAVLSLQPAVLSAAVSSQIELLGSRLGGGGGAGTGTADEEDGVHVSFGARACEVRARTDVSISCFLPRSVGPPTDDSDGPARVWRSSVGASVVTDASAALRSELQIDAVSPASGSLGGGTVLTLVGSGFAPDGVAAAAEQIVTVQFLDDGAELSCAVLEGTANRVLCELQPAADAVYNDILAGEIGGFLQAKRRRRLLDGELDGEVGADGADTTAASSRLPWGRLSGRRLDAGGLEAPHAEHYASAQRHVTSRRAHIGAGPAAAHARPAHLSHSPHARLAAAFGAAGAVRGPAAAHEHPLASTLRALKPSAARHAAFDTHHLLPPEHRRLQQRLHASALGAEQEERSRRALAERAAGAAVEAGAEAAPPPPPPPLPPPPAARVGRVRLVRNNVPARCADADGRCAFSLDFARTPLAHSVAPLAGWHVPPPPSDGGGGGGATGAGENATAAENATVVMVTLRGYVGANGSDALSARVFFGAVECAVGDAQPALDDSGRIDGVTLRVPLCAFAAGSVPVSVLVPTVGWALGAAGRGAVARSLPGEPAAEPFSSFAVEQLLRIDSLSPPNGSWYGGSRVTLRGSGFGGGVDEGAPAGSRARSSVLVAGLPCEVEMETHDTLTCFTSAVPAYRPLSEAGSLSRRVLCTFVGSGDSASAAACAASCDGHAACNTVNYRAFPRACERRVCPVSCTAASCSFDSTSSAEYRVLTKLPLARLTDGSATASLRVGAAAAMLARAFAYGAAADAPRLDALVPSGGEPGGELRLALNGSGWGADPGQAGLVVFGSAPTPARNLACALPSAGAGAWTDSSLVCARAADETPAGGWSVRVWSASSNGYSNPLPLVVLPQPLELRVANGAAANVSGAASGSGVAQLLGGHGGGLELTLLGAGLGLDATQTRLTVCGLPCELLASNGSSATCISPPVTTLELVDALPEQFPPSDLALSAANFSTNRPSDTTEVRFATEAFGGTIDVPRTLLADDGSWRNADAACWYAMTLPAEQAALVTAAKFYPAIDPARRELARQTVLQVRNVTVGAGSELADFADAAAWRTVGDVAQTAVTGDSIAQGWSAFTVSPPLVAQAFRVLLPRSACRQRGELFRAARFDGVTFHAADEAECAVALEAVRHPLADTAASPLVLRASLLHTLPHTPTLVSLEPRTGSARGGTTVTIVGTALDPLNAAGAALPATEALLAVRVQLNGYECAVQSVNGSAIVCVTGARRDALLPPSTRVTVGGRGRALRSAMDDTAFEYIDLWSDERSWLHSEKPADGDSVIVPLGQSILLDEDSPRLFLLLVQGRLHFARKDVALDATYIWVAGGTLQVGTETEPFVHRATITLHGDRWTTVELPFIGSKMLVVTNLGGLDGGCHVHAHGDAPPPSGPGAARTAADPCPARSVGRLELQGAPRRPWTRLVRTAAPGESALHLAEPVDWPIGAEILVTQSAAGEREELRRVAAIEDDGLTLRIDAPLANEHLGVWHWHDEGAAPSDLRAAVALLERNVVVQAGDESMRAGGAFQFGVHTGGFHGGVFRLRNVQLTRSGQAGNFGRYSSHWHHYTMAGRNIDIINGASYLKDNVYRDTFQRAVVVHGTDYATVTGNVAYRAKGHNFFTEEGPERYALFEGNLAVAAVPHPILLGDDSTPAGFWIPGFTGWHRHNLAVGCANGWKLNVQAGAGARQSGMDFHNNSAHACGFGWRLFPPHQPPTPNVFSTFVAFRCSTCMFYYSSGNLNHLDHRFIECGRAIHLNHYMNGLHAAPFFTDLVLVGSIDPSARSANAGSPAIHSPKDDEHWLVSGMHVSNYHDSAVLFGCFQTACTMRYERTVWVNSTRRTTSTGPLSGIFHDLDGTLTGFPNGWVSGDKAFNHWEDGVCIAGDSRFVDGLACGLADGSLRLRRLFVHDAEPWQLDGKDLLVTTPAGTDRVAFDTKTFGWHVYAIANRSYELEPDDANSWQSMATMYSHWNYVFETHGWSAGLPSSSIAPGTLAQPVVERLTIEIPYCHFRHHFDSDVGPRLEREPSQDDDVFGAHALRLNQSACELYANLSNASTAECSNWTNQSTLELKFELDQQPEQPQVDGRVKTVVSEKGAPRSMRAKLTARLCPVEGCPTPPRMPGVFGDFVLWSDPSVWQCARLTDGATIRQCRLRPSDRRARRLAEAIGGAAGRAVHSAARLLHARGTRSRRLLLAIRRTVQRRRLQFSTVPLDIEYRLPGEEDDVVIGPDESVLLDVATPRLNWLTVEGRLHASRTSHSTLTARSVLVWGQLHLGTPAEPIPANVSAQLRLWGDESDHTVVMVEGLFLGNKVLAVLGELQAAGTPLDAPLWTRLASTAMPGATTIAVRGDVRAWPVGGRLALAPTEYPAPPSTTELETLAIAAVGEYDAAADSTSVTLDRPLLHRHFADDVLTDADGAHWPRIALAAPVGLVGNFSNVAVLTDEEDAQHGGAIVIGGSLTGTWVGTANVSDIELWRLGKFALQQPAVRFDYVGQSAALERQAALGADESVLARVAFGQSQAGAVEINGGQAILLDGCVFHETLRSAVWVGKASAHDVVRIERNAAFGTLRHPSESNAWIRQFAAFLLEVRVASLVGNVAAGSADTGFVYRPHLADGACAAGADGSAPLERHELNEAVGCMVGLFVLRACPDASLCARCAAVRGFVAWKSSHVGVLTVDQNALTFRLSDVLVSDNHIGVSLNFHIFDPNEQDHRVAYHNLTVLGSTLASGSCAKSSECRAYGDIDSVAKVQGSSCNSVAGAGVRRFGVLAHMVNRLAKLCEGNPRLRVCRPPTLPVKACVMPWEHREGTLGARYSEAHWSSTTFGHFAHSDCGLRSAAFTSNPTSIDMNYPNRFEQTRWLSSAPPGAGRFFLEQWAANADNARDCAPGRECDSLQHMLLHDLDGTLNEVGPSGAGGMVVPAAAPAHAISSCSAPGGAFACPQLALRPLFWEAPGLASSETGRALGRFKSTRASDGRSTASRGPYDAMCLTSPALQSRQWAVRVGEELDLTLFVSHPKNQRFVLFSDEPSEAVRIALFLSQPFRLDVFRNGASIGSAFDSSDAANFAAAGAPRLPQVTDAHGTYAFDPQARTFYLTLRGAPGGRSGSTEVVLRMLMVVQLSLTLSVPQAEFDGANLIANLALLLSIDPKRIRIVQVQLERRRLSAGANGTSVQVQISEDFDDAEVGMLSQAVATDESLADENATNATAPDGGTVADTGFSSGAIAELGTISTALETAGQNGTLAVSLNQTILAIATVTTEISTHVRATFSIASDVASFGDAEQTAFIAALASYVGVPAEWVKIESIESASLLVNVRIFQPDDSTIDVAVALSGPISLQALAAALNVSLLSLPNLVLLVPPSPPPSPADITVGIDCVCMSSRTSRPYRALSDGGSTAIFAAVHAHGAATRPRRLNVAGKGGGGGGGRKAHAREAAAAAAERKAAATRRQSRLALISGAAERLFGGGGARSGARGRRGRELLFGGIGNMPPCPVELC